MVLQALHAFARRLLQVGIRQLQNFKDFLFYDKLAVSEMMHVDWQILSSYDFMVKVVLTIANTRKL